MKELRIQVAKCPKCKATCVVGSDDDFQVFCAHCHTTFKWEREETISTSEYRDRTERTDEYFVVGPWEAFYKP